MARKLYARINEAEIPLVLVRDREARTWRPEDDRPVDLKASDKGVFSVLIDGRSVRAFVLKEDREQGLVKVRIGGKLYTVALEDERAHLMQTLGLDKRAGMVSPELKAPMPGLVLNVLVKVGDAVRKNDPVLVLEAMKMENVIKAPGDAVVAQVHAVQGKAVEKGQLLLLFAKG
ncbi:MAG: acetyl-CoA carboxylase biotin carboxyl carrier protein subunit [Flavobacteriales bacterium]|nr:acetyl-CoA carboxylase biotin carboxyl carrier protein subunit [Flavobacteriales bacterium]